MITILNLLPDLPAGVDHVPRQRQTVKNPQQTSGLGLKQNMRLLGDGHLLSLCPHRPVMVKNWPNLLRWPQMAMRKGLTALLLLRLCGMF